MSAVALPTLITLPWHLERHRERKREREIQLMIAAAERVLS